MSFVFNNKYNHNFTIQIYTNKFFFFFLILLLLQTINNFVPLLFLLFARFHIQATREEVRQLRYYHYCFIILYIVLY